MRSVGQRSKEQGRRSREVRSREVRSREVRSREEGAGKKEQRRRSRIECAQEDLGMFRKSLA